MIETEDIRLSQERLAALKELITPIKDLAKNWDVDLNTELEKYMITFEQDVNSDNFAEAALVIQGSAGVWSKKVEFLYSLAVDSLGMLEEKEKKSRENRKSSGAEDDQDDEDEMMTLKPVVIKKAAQVHVNLSSLARSEHFKPRIPLYLSAISVKNDKPENLLYSKKGELLASRDDFAMNNCIINKFGFASLDIQTCLLLNQSNKKTAMTPFFKRSVSQYDGFVNEQNVISEPINLAAAVDEAIDVEQKEIAATLVDDQNLMEDDEIDPGGALDLCDDDSDHEVAVEAKDTASNSQLVTNEPKTPKPLHSMQLRSKLGISPTTDASPHENKVDSKITKKLDPFKELPVKPFKKATIEKPRASRKRKKEAAPKSSLLESLQSSDRISCSKSRFTNLIRKPEYPENIDLFKKLKKRCPHANSRLRKKAAEMTGKQVLPSDIMKVPQPVNPTELDSDDPGPEGLDDDEGDYCGTISAHPISSDNQPHPTENPLDNLETSRLEALEASQQESLIPPTAQPSYEDLVKEHVMKFTSEARNHFHVSELRGRVIEWENKITPILDEEEKQTGFDVCQYSNKLLSKLASCPEETASFRNLVSGERKGEVSRLFLTSLMLSNSGNIELKGDDEKTECKLLSRKLFSDVLEGYVAAGSEEVPATSSKRKRKNAPS